MKNCVGVFGLPFQRLDCFDGRQNKQFDLVTLGFALYSLHDGQSTVCTTADDELVHCQGISSSIESGVWPNCSRNFLEDFFLRLRISPRSMMTSCAYTVPSIWMEPKENLSKRIRKLLAQLAQALFFDVIALKADQHCSTSLLPQCGQTSSP